MLMRTLIDDLFPGAYIPPEPNPLPSVPALTKEERKEKRVLAKLRREREAALRALQMPLVFALEIQEFEGDVEEETTTVTATGPILEEGLDPVNWTVDDIVDLHSAMIKQSLKALAAKGNPREKLEILEWMFETDYVGEIYRDTPYGPRKVRVTNHNIPFSFAFCCRLEGHDPDRYRSFIAREMPEEVMRFITASPFLKHNDFVPETGADRLIWL